MSELRSPRMTRMRTIKPEFFKHEGLYDLEQSSGLPVRLGLAGLWVCCDRDGLFEWQPRRLKIEIFPYDNLEFGKVLESLLGGGFIQRYEVDGKQYGCIPTWHKHQSPNGREPASGIPTPPNFTRGPRVADASSTGEGRSAEFAIVSVNGNVNGSVEGSVSGTQLQPQSHSPAEQDVHSFPLSNGNSNRTQHSQSNPKPGPTQTPVSVQDDLEWEMLPDQSKLARLFWESLPQENRDAAPDKWETLWSKDFGGLTDHFQIICDVMDYVQASKWKRLIVRGKMFVEKYPQIKTEMTKIKKAKTNGKFTPPLTVREQASQECDHGVIRGMCAVCDA